MNKKLFALFLLCSTLEVQVKAEEAVVIEVKKNISLSKTDKVYRHYFINGGAEQGLAKGATVDVVRRVAVHDPLKNASIGDIRVKVAQLEIIQADPKISVAKLVNLETPETRPVLDYEAIMIGDRLDLSSIKVAKKVALLDVDSQAKMTSKEGSRAPASLKKGKGKSKKVNNKRH